ncbi:hypothetical protein KL942_003341 [Ogataea angusta]|uniref:ATP-dependent bile acid permease n=1 Tax=Pichia angusta TaxID=870730 RepID=A0ABQ7RWC1_PICAN|nr:hypothetical protein KL942_003341 [Ogataea angusta]KAG7849363.1 hypothetical protein KL940_003045 [Ogataea angusta]
MSLASSNSTLCDSYWAVDDFTTCGRQLVESWVSVPLVLSALAVAFNLLRNSLASEKTDPYSKLDAEQQPLLQNGHALYTSSIDSDNTDIFQRHFDIALLKPVKENGKPIGVLRIVYRDTAEKLKVAIEGILLLSQTILAFLALSRLEEFSKSRFPLVKYIDFLLWLYLTVITSARLLNVSKGFSASRVDLWYHCAILYNLQWFNSAMLFRSALLHHVSGSYGYWFYVSQFVINTLLCLTIGVEKLSDKPAIVYEEEGVTPSPETTSSLIDIMTYGYLDKMVFSSYWKPITMEEVWGLRYDDYSHDVLIRFHKLRSSIRFTLRLFLQFKKELALQTLCTCVEAILIFVPSLCLKKILEYIESPHTKSRSMAWFYVLIMFGSGLIACSFSGRSLFLGRRICTRMRSILIGEIYSKALRRRLGTTEKEKPTEEEDDKSAKPKKEEESSNKELGGIINLMAVDAFKVSEIGGYLHYFPNSFVMAAVAIYMLYKLLGWSSLIGTATLIAILPINYMLVEKLSKYQKQMLLVTDKRIQKTNEAFQNIRIIKYFAWEDKFADTIMKIREEELGYLVGRCVVWALLIFLWLVVPTVVTLITFYAYTVIQGSPLTSPIAFTALSLFTLLRGPLDALADMLSMVMQCKVSLDRVEDFLNEPETTKYQQLSAPRGPNSPLIGFENATFYWSKNSKAEFALKDLNIDFKVGKLNVVIGPTGSGKSSLLLALLGEMDLDKGIVFLPGAIPRDDLTPNPVTGLMESVAYCSQTAWLLNATVKENIIFASPFNQERYDAVIHACGLTRDLSILEAGDETEIGEKGITLSGGQKQRVSLARALYSSASYLLLDDCLSAVDSHTAVHIYEYCINGELMKGRTCILVSHNVSLTIKEADFVVMMDNGRIKAQGSVDELMQEGLLNEEVVKSVMQSRSASTANLAALDDNSQISSEAIAEGLAKNIAKKIQKPQQSKKSKLIEDETKSDGSVKPEIYYAYFRYFGNPALWIMIAFLFIGSQSVNVYQSYWLRRWSAIEDKRDISAFSSLSDTTLLLFPTFHSINWHRPLVEYALQPFGFAVEERSTMYYITIYTLIGLAFATLGSSRVILTFLGGLNVSRKIFKDLLDKLLHARLRFFDQTPIGRIMNRFSKDIEAIDQELALYAEEFVTYLISCLSTLVVVCAVTPAFFVAGVLILLVYYGVGVLYLELSRDLKRFESITKSPIHQHFSETLVGMTTIRAYGDERRFLKQNFEKIDVNNRPFWYVWVNNRWLAYRSDMIGAFIIFFAAAFAVAYSDKIDAGLAGISLSFSVSFRYTAVWVVRMYAYVEMSMNSVERVQEYIEQTPQEPPKYLPQDPVNSWPSNGVIDVQDICIRYSPELPRVIDNVSFHVNAGEKIGVVGRTGAGKSTIITSFFRFVDLESGSIKIDGLDISKIGLKSLRKGLTIIPQDPTLFSGTIRSNLDIFGEYGDLQMFEALRRVNLISIEDYQRIVDRNGAAVADETAQARGDNVNKFLDLDSTVSEGGGNLSQGERQLLCLARSILKMPKILMLDEATASIDYESDAKIQATIREEFSTSTVLTIAHRLKTIIDYDKILLLDHGKVKEYDHPYKLITNKKSDFRKMCQDTGEFDDLVNLAKQAYKK